MEEQNITTNISAFKDTSKMHLDNSDINNYTYEDRYNVSFSKSQRKNRKKSLAIQDNYYNYEQQQKDLELQEIPQENDKSTIEFQLQQNSQLKSEQKVSPKQNRICFKGVNEDTFQESVLNEIDLFQKPQNDNQRNHHELPTLKIQIKRSTKTNREIDDVLMMLIGIEFINSFFLYKVDGEDLQNYSHVSSNASPGLRRWKKLSIVMKTIQAFQKSEIKNIQPNDIEEEIKNSPSPRKKKEDNHKAFNYEQDFEMMKILDNYRRVEELCYLCKNGSSQDLEKIKNIISSDPKRYIRSPEDPEHLINKQNSQGLFPLYIACMNQNIEVQFYLLFKKFIFLCNKKDCKVSIENRSYPKHQNQSNLHLFILSFILKDKNTFYKNQDTCLEVAARWRYVNIVQILLEYESKLETKDLENSRKACGNHHEIDEQIQKIIFKRSKNIFKYCLPCFF